MISLKICGHPRENLHVMLPRFKMKKKISVKWFISINSCANHPFWVCLNMRGFDLAVHFLVAFMLVPNLQLAKRGTVLLDCSQNRKEVMVTVRIIFGLREIRNNWIWQFWSDTKTQMTYSLSHLSFSYFLSSLHACYLNSTTYIFLGERFISCVFLSIINSSFLFVASQELGREQLSTAIFHFQTRVQFVGRQMAVEK